MSRDKDFDQWWRTCSNVCSAFRILDGGEA